ncbi:MAG: SDR family oxidoreductase [Bacteroidota bacterium]
MILVTGGTGLVGAHLLFELCKDHESIKATYRNPKKMALVKKIFSYYTDRPEALFDKIIWIQANLLDVPSLAPAFRDVKKVYHAAALVSFDPKEEKKLVATNIEGTANIVNLCIEHAVEKLCFVSSIAALGPSVNGKPITEENEWTNGSTMYAVSKHFAEMEVWRASQEGIPVVIVNPGIVVAPGFWRSSSGSFFHQSAKGPKYHLPSGTGFVGVYDVTSAMVQLMESTVSNQRYILVNQNWTYKSFAHLLAKGLKRPLPEKEIKAWILDLFWRWDWFRSHLLGKRRRLSKAVAQLFKTRDFYDGSKIINDLDFDYEDLEKSIEHYCSIYLREQNQST